LALNEEGDPARMTTLLEESLALAREAGDTDRTVGALCNLGYATLMQGDYERVSTLGNEALSLARDLGGTGMEALPEILINSELASLQQGYHKQADASFKEALAASEKARIKSSTINALEGMASLAGVMGDAVGAAHLWGAAKAARGATGIALPPGEQELHEPYLASARSQIGEAVWKEALTEGRAMSLEEATQYGLSKELDSPATLVPEELPDVEPAGDLTQREQEVAGLVAQGLTNRQGAQDSRSPSAP